MHAFRYLDAAGLEDLGARADFGAQSLGPERVWDAASGMRDLNGVGAAVVDGWEL
jgi:hypothetical protein